MLQALHRLTNELLEITNESRRYFPAGRKSADEELDQRRLWLAMVEHVDAIRDELQMGRGDALLPLAFLQNLLHERAQLLEQVTAAQNTGNRFLEHRRQLKGMLKKLEWTDDQEEAGRPSFCEFCGNYKGDGHKPGCEWVAAMALT